MKTPLLIGTFGYPGSGKTYFSERLCKKNNWFHLSSDRIRLKLFPEPQHTPEEGKALFDFMDYIAAEFLRKGVSVVYDANFNFVRNREGLAKIASENGANYVLVWIQTDENIAKQRVGSRHENLPPEKQDLYRPISTDVFQHLKDEMEIPDSSEKVIVINGEDSFITQLDAFNNQA